MNETQRAAARAYEEALNEVYEAKDSEGHRIILLPAEPRSIVERAAGCPPTSGHVIETLRSRGREYFSKPRFAIAFYAEGTTGEEALLRNIGLLATAAAAALAYERTL